MPPDNTLGAGTGTGARAGDEDPLSARRVAMTRRGLLATAVIAAGGVVLRAAPAAARSRRASVEHVILIDWDGFGNDLLDRVPMPNVQNLILRGSLSIADSTYNTYSNSARASMSTGAHPEVHGNAGYYLNRERDVVISQDRELRAQTISQALAEQGLTTASVGWYMVQDFGAAYGDPEHLYVQPGVAAQHEGRLGAGFATRVDVAIDILNRRPVDSAGEAVTVPRVPRFLAVYAGEIDALLHEQGPSSPRLPPLLIDYDRELGRLVQGVRNAGIAERTALLLTADHGFSTWTRTVMPALVEAIGAGGLRPEVVTVGRSPAADTEVVLISNGCGCPTSTCAARPPARTDARSYARLPLALGASPTCLTSSTCAACGPVTSSATWRWRLSPRTTSRS
jgi:hypothetical protein